MNLLLVSVLVLLLKFLIFLSLWIIEVCCLVDINLILFLFGFLCKNLLMILFIFFFIVVMLMLFFMLIVILKIDVICSL